jgi:GT2 family glycosyltransferase/glycosyltransferase involved in cell wall biosynthesis
MPRRVAGALHSAFTGRREPTPRETERLRRWVAPSPARYDLIVLANVDWRTRRQRPQQLAAAFAAHGHRVFYIVASRFLSESHRTGYELTEVEPGVWEVVLSGPRHHDPYTAIPAEPFVSAWGRAMSRLGTDLHIEHAAVHVHLPSWTPLAFALRAAHGWRVIYDCMDEWDGFPGIGMDLVLAERELVAGADLVAVTAESLRQKWSSSNPRCLLVRNAADAAWLVEAAGPSDLLVDIVRPVIGFCGAIAEWVDVALLAAVARSRPDWSFVLVGDIFVDDLAGLDTLPNVRITGLRPYEEIPLWIFAFDVAVIPFVINAISASVDPVKFYEYVALGTPVVTTPLPELDHHREHFYVADGPRAFEAGIEAALTEPLERESARASVALGNTWLDRYRVLDTATAELWPLVSIIVPTFGRLDLTRACIDSLLAHTGHPNWELIVVDNASPDGSPAYLRHVEAAEDHVHVVLNRENRGFAAACNQGLDLARGDVLVLLNNDTVVPPGWLTPLVDHLGDPEAGLVGPRSNSVGNEARLDVEYTDMGEMAALADRLRRGHAGESFDIHMLGMFCVAMRRDVYEAVGPLDEGYGIGLFEDDDYAERVRAAGLHILCARDAFVHHVGQGTFEALARSGEYDGLWNRNRARFEARWGPWTAQAGGPPNGHRDECIGRPERPFDAQAVLVRPLLRGAYRVGRAAGRRLAPDHQDEIRARLSPLVARVAPRAALASSYQEARARRERYWGDRRLSGGSRAPRLAAGEMLPPSPRSDALDVVVLPVIDWYFRHQRPQQLAAHLAAAGHRVVYLTTDFERDRPGLPPFRLLEQVRDRVWTARLACPDPHPAIHTDRLDRDRARFLAHALHRLEQDLGLHNVVLVAQHPFWYDVVAASARDLLVYDLIDDHAGFQGAGTWVADVEHDLMEGADLVVATSASLLETKTKAARAVVVPNAAEVDRFRAAASAVVRDPGRRPVVGYVGAIEYWFDTALIEVCARAHPDWDFVLVGGVVGDEALRLETLENVRLLGERPYDRVPGLVAGFDVCLIPFLIVPLTRHTNPVKAYEYLSAGKPVVATALPDLVGMEPHVRIGRDHAEFLVALAAAMKEADDADLVCARTAWAMQHSWKVRAREFERAVFDGLPA